MKRFNVILSMLLMLAVAGGAQACLVMCDSAQPKASPQPVKSSCHRCAQKTPPQSKSLPAAPCPHCFGSSKDQVTPDRDNLVKAPTLAAMLPASMTLITAPVSLSLDEIRLEHSPPPASLLHQICVLLI